MATNSHWHSFLKFATQIHISILKVFITCSVVVAQTALGPQTETEQGRIRTLTLWMRFSPSDTLSQQRSSQRPLVWLLVFCPCACESLTECSSMGRDRQFAPFLCSSASRRLAKRLHPFAISLCFLQQRSVRKLERAQTAACYVAPLREQTQWQPARVLALLQPEALARHCLFC